jgi:hypothetical protein
MKVWISRDNMDSVRDIIKVWERKPNKTSDSCFYDSISSSSGWLIMSANDFKERFGFRPRKGSCKEYNLVLAALRR